MTRESDLEAQVTGNAGPLFIYRVAALPICSADVIRTSSLSHHLDRAFELDKAIEDTRDEVSTLLYSAVGAVEDRTERALLLRVRRDLYQGRGLREHVTSIVSALLPAAGMAAVERFCALLRARASLNVTLAADYEVALRECRSRFIRVLENEDFRKGLLLSSRTLYKNLARYGNAVRANTIRARDEQIERGILRYFLRATMKATPFATFCSVGQGTAGAVQQANRAIGFNANPTRQRSHLRLNKGIYALLWRRLKDRRVVRDHLCIDVNPTCEVDGNSLRFLASQDGREIFQRLTRSEALDIVLDFVRSRPGEPLQHLAAALADNPELETDAEEVASCLDSLLAHGLLRARALVPEQCAEWDAPLARALAAIDDEHAQLVAATLVKVRRLVNQYEHGNVLERERLLDETRELLLSTLMEIQPGATIPRELPFFEDASTEAELEVGFQSTLERPLDELREWIALTHCVSHPRAQQATLRHFFDSKYSDDVERVALLCFYEDFYREHFKEHLEKELRFKRNPLESDLAGYDFANPYRLPYIRTVHRAKSKLTALVREAWASKPDAEFIEVGLDAVRAVMIEHGLPTIPQRMGSCTLFCQILPPAEREAAGRILAAHGQYNIGYGKCFSRFLYFLPSSLQEQIRAKNKRLAGEDILAEICSDADFNANLHPPIMPAEVCYPAVDATVQLTEQLNVSQLDVVRSPVDPFALDLVDRATGRRVLPVDVGFLNPQLRPALYQLLLRFAPSGTYGLILPEHPKQALEQFGTAPAKIEDRSGSGPYASQADPAREQNDQDSPDEWAERVVYRPRVMIGSSVVIARRRWTVPESLFPRPNAGEASSDYLLRLDSWRRAAGIPRDSYLRVVSRQQQLLRNAQVTTTEDAHGVLEFDGSDEEVPESFARKGAAEQAAPLGANVAERADLVGPTKRMTGSRTIRPRSDDHKPQFIDFGSPMLVQLLARAGLGRKNILLVFEECLPTREMLPTAAERAYSTEVVLQLDFEDWGAASSVGCVTTPSSEHARPFNRD